MQEKMRDGSFGEPVPFNKEEMEKSLDNPEVESVEVFRATKNELKRRRRLFEDSQQAKSRAKRKKKNKQSRKSRRN